MRLGDDVAAHQPARALGVEADDLVAPALPVLEHRGDDAALELLRLDRLEVLVGGEVQQHALAAGLFLAREQAVELVGDALAPELVEVLAARVGEPGAHLQAVGLHQVERTQHAVKAGQDAQVLLRPGQVVVVEALRVEPFIDVAVEGEQRLLGVVGGEGPRPARVARDVEAWKADPRATSARRSRPATSRAAPRSARRRGRGSRAG